MDTIFSDYIPILLWIKYCPYYYLRKAPELQRIYHKDRRAHAYDNLMCTTLEFRVILETLFVFTYYFIYNAVLDRSPRLHTTKCTT